MTDPISAGIGLLDTFIGKFVKDKDQAEQLMAAAKSQEFAGHLETFKQRVAVIVAEANSKVWITAAWRPITMLSFVAIIVNNYMFYPYLSLFWSDAPKMEIPPDMWDLLKLGLGGYVVGRSAEKVAKNWKGGADNG